MSHVNDPGNTTQDAYTVVVNDAGQYSLWRASADPPAGWRRRSAVMSWPACLDAIAVAWQDIAPARDRVAVPGPRSPAGSARDEAADRATPGHDARFVHQRFAEQASRRP